MSVFIPTLQRLEKLVPELVQVKSGKHCLILLKTATLRWVMVRSLYDSDCDLQVEFEQEWFKAAQWQEQFSQQLFPGIKLTVDELLFAEYTNITKQQFLSSLKKRYHLNQGDIDHFLTYFPFQVEERTIRNNLTALSQLRDSLLDKRGQGNYRLKKLDGILEILGLNERASEQQYLIISDDSYSLLDFLTSELSTIAELLLVKINEQQRLFIHNDYVVAEELREPAADLADRLKEIWKEKPVPPIQISYHSASLNKKGKYLVYPVCLYYYQRAYYLCAFGQAPPNQNRKQVQWYNYRLERISKISKLSWDEPNLPFSSQQILDQEQIYSPAYIQSQLESAYGFDFYQKKEVMLLRFDPDFARRYIDNSFRHQTFEKIEDIEEVISIISQSGGELKDLLTAYVKEFLNSAYYVLSYRQNDNNVVMRLRAWGPMVEVLLPLDLRQRVREDVEKTWEFYHLPF
ncbi:MAG: TIGR03985 family CRISPR-associated protein [Xenococcaceae cyanobacterium]